MRRVRKVDFNPAPMSRLHDGEEYLSIHNASPLMVFHFDTETHPMPYQYTILMPKNWLTPIKMVNELISMTVVTFISVEVLQPPTP